MNKMTMVSKLENIITGTNAFLCVSLISSTLIVGHYGDYLRKKYPVSGKIPSAFNSREDFEKSLNLRVYDLNPGSKPTKDKPGVAAFRNYAIIRDVSIISLVSGLFFLGGLKIVSFVRD